jgi:hypothetical protein
MLAKEDIISYEWLLKSFKKAFPREPQVVLTDQDPSMKIAVSGVFKNARHRLCMWHIMEKVSVKVNLNHLFCIQIRFSYKICILKLNFKLNRILI